jgi:hypothetical protein
LEPTGWQETATGSVPSAALSIEERLAFINAAMTVRLEEVGIAYEVNTAHIDTEPVDLADVVPPPADPHAPAADAGRGAPERAHHRLLTGGWCTGALVDAEGARCLYGAIHMEARGDQSLESRGLEILMDAIRRQFGDVDSVPSFNDGFASGRIPMRMLDQAAGLADARLL